MKKIIALAILIIAIFSNTITVHAASMDSLTDFSEIYDDHGAVMMLIDPNTGEIIYANKAASTFLGYAVDKLESMNISDINAMTPEEIEKETETAIEQQRNYHILKYRLSNGETRIVEVYLYPFLFEGKNVQFYIINDITKSINLEQVTIKKDTAIIAILSIGIIILLFSLYIILIKNRRKLKLAKTETENFNQLGQAFINADYNLVYLKDENLKYMFINQAFENLYQKKAEEVIGFDDFNLGTDDFSKQRRKSDLAVLEKKTFLVGEEEWEGRVYKTIKFPVRMFNGEYGVGAYQMDITEEREKTKKLQRMMYRHKILVDVMTMRFQSVQEQLDYVLHQSLLLTESQYGYIYIYSEDTSEFTLNSWTNGVMQDCSVIEPQTKYQLDKTGIWGEVVRQRKPIVINDFEQANPLKKGYPQGHVQLKKYMSIPVIVDEKIVAVVGLANNSSGYDDNDVVEMTLLMSGVWNAIKRREMQLNLFVERNKYLQTLISIGDGVIVVNTNGEIEIVNTVAQKLTGWTQEEAIGKNYKEVFVLSCEITDCVINDPIADVLATNKKQELGNHAILTSKDGVDYCIEDSAAPIVDDTGATKGVVLVFRDVTDKKEQRKEIEYLSSHDTMTGLLNRSCFEDNRSKIDIPDNLPISLIFADINGLKMTNDIFGHTAGDELIKKSAEILMQSCRENDVIARVGGDEFIILLPKTDNEEAEAIISRIKTGFSNAHLEAIKCSVALGSATKVSQDQPLHEIMTNAENAMYNDKTMNRKSINKDIIDTIIETLHARNQREKQHSISVSQLCSDVGTALHLPETEISKLKRAGYLHDIGKIVLDERIQSKDILTDEEHEKRRQHSVVGYRILSLFDDTLDLAEYVYSHHERWDGTGYPRGLKGEQIPLLSRIIAIAENYDRVLNKGELPLNNRKLAAFDIIKNGAGTKFDPQIAELFIQLTEKSEEV